MASASTSHSAPSAAKTPESKVNYHKKDVIRNYFRSENKERDEHLRKWEASAHDKDKEKLRMVGSEQRRVEKARERIATDVKTQKVVQEFEKAQKVWRAKWQEKVAREAEVKRQPTGSGMAQRKARRRSSLAGAPTTARTPQPAARTTSTTTETIPEDAQAKDTAGSTDASRRVTAEASGSQALKANPPKDGGTSKDQSSVDQEPELDEFKIAVMHFKRATDGHGWEGASYVPPAGQEKCCSGKFPDQKITLRKGLRNDFNPIAGGKDAEERIRYFHLPANHMGWVEVSAKQFPQLLVTRIHRLTRLEANHGEIL
jgi:hypothetical protein